MLIGVLGYTDKRPVIYALMKILQATGDVAVITSNRHYKRLLEDHASFGHMANIMIAVTDATPDEVFHEIEHTQDDFDHIIFDIQDTVPEKVDLMYYVKGYDYEEGEKDFLDCIGEYTTVNMMYGGRSEKGSINVPLTLSLISTIEVIESKKILMGIPSKSLNQGLARGLAGVLSLGYKEAMKILTRGWNKR
ncbi:hypothetical protein [Vallitalea okinawensis]|uniref:hypothetical protein n=1 Tax=Vallitalea okinawensis TaxID=2078660 RepID=UPI000CFDCBA0|nr:hypothetical protein [Vallitalea okinawensis]